ncbi:glycosyltransferase family 2 protein [Candidatus Pelagibacter sp.]|nr:glycosyltransferase family 2 protein [Candidatus Pelagibacter sp.]
MTKILCAVICYNNENTINSVIKEINKIKNKFDIIFINDGSTDKTKNILNSFKTKVINHKKNLGYGGAVNSAIKFAKVKKYKYFAIFPGDNQRYIKDLLMMGRVIKSSKLDLIIGSKYKILKNIPFHRKIGNIFFSKVAKIFWNSKIKDVLSGFKIYRVNAFYKYHKFFPNNYSFDIVLSQFISFKELNFREIFVKCRYNIHTTSMKGIFKIHKKNILFIGLMMTIDVLKYYLKYKLRLVI